MEDSPKVVELWATRGVGDRLLRHDGGGATRVYQDFASDPMVLITPNTEKYQAFAGKLFPHRAPERGNVHQPRKRAARHPIRPAGELLSELGIDISQLAHCGRDPFDRERQADGS